MHPSVAADMEAHGMLVFQNSGGTVEYASNGVGITSTQVGYLGRVLLTINPAVTPTGGTTGDALGYTYLAAPGDPHWFTVPAVN